MTEQGDPNSSPVHYDRVGAIAVIVIDNGPVNALGQNLRRALVQAVDTFVQDDAEIAVLLGAGRMFVGGADIKEFGKPPVAPDLPSVIAHIESCAKPIVAAMHGNALGGGLELALGCHYRLAMPGCKLGLPEVTLGLLPGAGGTQRLPRLTGVESALEFILSGTPITAETALPMGVIDRLGTSDLRSSALAFAQDLLDRGAGPRRVGDLPRPAPNPAAFAAMQAKLAKTARGLASPFAIVKALQAACDMDLTDGLAEERRLFLEMMQTPQRAGLIHAFFVERKVAALPALEGVVARPLRQIGVVGGGTMGAGIATSALLAGYPVTLVERDEKAANTARTTIAANLAAAVTRGKLTQAASAAILTDALACVTDYAALSNADLAIEAVFESFDVKTAVFAQLDAVLKPGAILATNTSYLDVNRLAAATSRPQDVIGLHFFSPAHVMKLLEIVVASSTAPDVIATAFALGKSLGKVCVKSGVCDGFIGNRILAAYRGAADRMILQGASPFQIDTALVDFGFAMGPYAVADLAGLDIGFLTRQRKEASRDPRDIVPGWADELVHLGRLGQKTGSGYYLYPAGSRTGLPDPQTDALIAKYRPVTSPPARAFTDAQIQRRYLAAMVNEAAKVLHDGIAARPLDIDATLLFGYGFPRHHGGPLHWADSVGLSALLQDINDWAQYDPFFWAPAPLLERLVAENSLFASLNG